MRPFANQTFFVVALLYAAATSAATSVGSWSNSYFNLTMTLKDSVGVADIQASLLNGLAGWYGFGIGDSMATSKMLVMWVNPDGSPTVSLRDPSPHHMPMPSSNQSVITGVTQSPSGTIRFTMPLSASDYSLSNQSKYFIWGYSPQVPSVNDPTAAIGRHNAFGTFSIPFVTSPESTASSPTSTGSNPAQGGGGGDSSSSEDEGTHSSSLPYGTLTIIHGILGFVAWAVFAPLSIFIASFGRHLSKWVPLHYGIHIFGVALLTIVVFALGYVLSNDDVHFVSPHQIIGLVMFVVMFVQIFLGWLSHHFYDPARTHRPIRNHLHRFLGIFILLLGFVQISLGFAMYGVVTSLQIAYSCWVGAWVLAFAIFSVLLRRREVHKRTATAGAISETEDEVKDEKRRLSAN